jgi:shikimate dehydrogenase
MGAVNTLMRREGQVIGANTDVPGFFAHLDAAAPGWDAARPHVLLLGAGGGARAILHGLMARPIGRLSLANRSTARADALLAGIKPPVPCDVTPWPVTAQALAEADLIINATALGMAGQPPLELPWPERMAGKVVYDIVYVPLETPFLREGQRRGAVAVDGLGMLLQQAAIAFAHWFGEQPVVDAALRERVAADVRAKTPG